MEQSRHRGRGGGQLQDAQAPYQSGDTGKRPQYREHDRGDEGRPSRARSRDLPGIQHPRHHVRRRGDVRDRIDGARRRDRDLLRRLPQGYETMLGERGQGLSGGEIRRVALARALLKPADLLVLDEAEASLDPETARLIRASIAALPRGMTVLLIAHRLEAALAADRVLVVNSGRIVEEGAPADLLARGGPFAAMSAVYEEVLP
ncbi:MAG: hypothetical protein B7Z81_08070 [Acidocella sp. 20-61-6]|nr:MAG: hypothetical protein B7Z81_08070 [Acidocella sp. 20-61-6]